MIRITNYNVLGFDDIQLLPNYSKIKTRKRISLKTELVGNIELESPIISANMNSVTEIKMAQVLENNKALGIIHRFMSFREQWNNINTLSGPKVLSIGVKQKDYDNLESIRCVRFPSDFCFLIDIAHGHSKLCIDMIKYLKKTFNHIPVIAGNVCSYDGALSLITAGADGIKCGISMGSQCSTRFKTGCGSPQVYAILQCAGAIKDFESENPNKKITLISDGSIRHPGDIVKALALGADSVMIGKLFAGTDEAPGNIIENEGRKYKVYMGMASRSAQSSIGIERSPEGIQTLIECKGSVVPILKEMQEDIRSGLSYLGCNKISDLKNKKIEVLRIK